MRITGSEQRAGRRAGGGNGIDNEGADQLIQLPDEDPPRGIRAADNDATGGFVCFDKMRAIRC